MGTFLIKAKAEHEKEPQNALTNNYACKQNTPNTSQPPQPHNWAWRETGIEID